MSPKIASHYSLERFSRPSQREGAPKWSPETPWGEKMGQGTQGAREARMCRIEHQRGDSCMERELLRCAPSPPSTLSKAMICAWMWGNYPSWGKKHPKRIRPMISDTHIWPWIVPVSTNQTGKAHNSQTTRNSTEKGFDLIAWQNYPYIKHCGGPV